MPEPDTFNPVHGMPDAVAPKVRRIVAPNPSPMTYRGTNTYLVGTQGLAVIDPGPDKEAHLHAILAAVEPHQRITHIIVTHAHLDHSQLAPRLAEKTGARIYAFGPAQRGRSDIMRQLASSGLAGGGEGVDHAFRPHIEVADGARIEGDAWALDMLHTPGHIGNHICLGLDDLCFTADHVMGWSTSLVSPPDGDLTDFMASCARLNTRKWQLFLPGHGDIVTAPNDRLDWLIAHRKAREAAVIKVLRKGTSNARRITREVYHDVPESMLPAAERNVLAHLIDLLGKSVLSHKGSLSAETEFELVRGAFQ